MSKSGLDYWVTWQVPVCALIILIPFISSFLLLKKIKAGPLYFNDLWKPCWRNLNPLWLLLYRAFAFLCLATILFLVVASDGAFVFYFYTQWTFSLVMVYFAMGTVISGYGCWENLKKADSKNGVNDEFLRRDVEEEKEMGNIKSNIELDSHYAEEEEIHKPAGFWGYLMQIIYQTCGGAVILTDIVFWCVLVPFLSDSHFGLNTLMVCMHTLNAIFLLLDASLNSLPFPWFRLAFFVQWSCLYVVFQWVIHACGLATWWPYPFLELGTPWAPLWYFAMAVIHIPCYGSFTLIIQAKNSFLPKLFPRAFMRSY